MNNENAYQVLQKINEKKLSWDDAKKQVSQLYGIDIKTIWKGDFYKSFTNVKKCRRKLMKNIRDKCALKDYLSQPFELFGTSVNRNRCQAAVQKNEKDPPAKRPQFKELHSQLNCDVVTTLKSKIHLLNVKIESLEKENVQLKKVNAQLQERCIAQNPKRLNQTIKRKNLSNDKLRHKCRELRKIALNVEKLQNKLISVKAEKRKLMWNKHQHSLRKKDCKKQNKEISSKINFSTVERLIEKNKEIESHKNKIDYMEYQLVTAEKSPTKEIECKDDGKTYSHKIREACYNLQNYGVSQINVSDALESVMKCFDLDVSGKLPSYGTQNQFATEMKVMARQQVKDALHDKVNLTEKYDGTTKPLGHLVEVEVASEKSTYLLGLKEQVGGRAVDYAESIKQNFSGIESTLTPQGHDLHLLHNIANTMTDRCVTNSAVDDILEVEKGNSLNRFKCAMHPLDCIAKEMDKTVKAFEGNNTQTSKITGPMPFKHNNESSTQALVRTAAKLFHSTQYSCSKDLTQYLKMNGLIAKDSVVYFRFVGNRFHIFMLSCGILYHYGPHIVNFFKSHFMPKNTVHQCILNALQIVEVQSAMRAVGLFGKLVSGPWMRVLGKVSNILEMNTLFKEAYDYLIRWSTDASFFMNHTSPPTAFGSVAPVLEDPVLISLLKPTAHDEAVRLLLQDLFKACMRVMERQLKDQMPGGLFWEPSDQLLQESASCGPTNLSGERNFAIADQAMLKARNAKISHIESKVMYKVNKTGKWLADMGASEKKIRSKLCIKQARDVNISDKESRKTVGELIQARLQENRKKILAKEDKDRDKFENYLDTIYQQGGLWTSEVDMERNLKNLKTKKEKSTGVNAQIQVRIKFLEFQPKSKISISKASLVQSKLYLLDLIQMHVNDRVSDLYELILNPESIVGHGFSQMWEKDGTSEWWTGIIVNILKNKYEQYEYEMAYDNSPTSYMTVSEVVVDILRGDLDLH